MSNARDSKRSLFKLICLGLLGAVSLMLMSCAAGAQSNLETQLVRVQVAYEPSAVGAKLQYEQPYSYTVKVDPWIFTVYPADVQKQPHEIEWVVTDNNGFPLDFVITFDDTTHFGKRELRSENYKRGTVEPAKHKNGGRAKSGKLIGSPRNDRYSYAIKVHLPMLDTPAMDRERHFLLLDPNYVVED